MLLTASTRHSLTLKGRFGFLAPATAVGLLIWTSVVVVAAEPVDEASTPDQAMIQQWVKDLSSDSYLRRKRASTDLMRVGSGAIDTLVDALKNGELETTERAIRILQEIAVDQPIIPKALNSADSAENATDVTSPDAPTVDAWEALQKITLLGGSRGARAKLAAGEVREVRRIAAVEALTGAGAFVGITEFVIGASSQLKKILQIDERFTGDAGVLNLLRWIDGIVYARIKGPAINAETLQAISQMPDLETIAIVEGDIDDAALRNLDGMPNLRNLEFRYVSLDDELIDRLGKLPIRVSLTLSGTNTPPEKVDELRRIVPGLHIEYKQGGFLGVQCFDNGNECLINHVQTASGAEAAGLIAGDVVIEVDGQPIKQFKDLQAAINAHVPGDAIKIRYVRGQRQRDTTARLGRMRESSQPRP